jgi:hypothetical protein
MLLTVDEIIATPFDANDLHLWYLIVNQSGADGCPKQVKKLVVEVPRY